MRSDGALLVALLCLAAPAAAHGGATVGAPAPPFRLMGAHGRTITLRSFRGHALYINVFASWCPPCRGELPRIVAARTKYAPRIAFLGVDAQEPASVARTFARTMHVDFPVGVDGGQMAVTYGAVTLPESVFVDRDGVVRAIVHGVIDAATLERELSRIAAASSKGVS